MRSVASSSPVNIGREVCDGLVAGMVMLLGPNGCLIPGLTRGVDFGEFLGSHVGVLVDSKGVSPPRVLVVRFDLIRVRSR